MHSEDIYRRSKAMMCKTGFTGVYGSHYKKVLAECEARPLTGPEYVYSHISFAGHYIFCPDSLFARDPVNTYDLLFVRSGTLRVVRDGKTLSAGDGCAVFLSSGTAYSVASEDGSEPEVFLLSHYGRTSEEYGALILKGSNSDSMRCLRVRDANSFSDIIDKISLYLRHNQPDDIVLCSGALIQLFTELYMSGLDPEIYDKNTGYPKWLLNALRYIDSNYALRITLNDLALQCGMSISCFQKQFKEQIGYPPYEYIIRARIEKSKTLLKDKELLIKVIASDTGFRSPSHFIAHFKRITGTTPERFRQESISPDQSAFFKTAE